MNKSYIKSLYNKNIFTNIDLHFAKFINELENADDSDLFLAAALVSNAAGNGDVCLDLKAFAGKVILEKGEDYKRLACPLLDIWIEKLKITNVVGKPGDYRPLILDDKNRLYLHKFWYYENTLSKAIKNKADDDITWPDTKLDENHVRKLLDKYFPDVAGERINLQKLASLVCVYKRLCIMSGGPGTGKTTAIGKILAVLIEVESGDKQKIYLCAPTGKAAAKLSESIRNTKKNIDCSDEIKNLIPQDAYTIHRMLKTISRSSGFHYNADNKLPADIVVIDEASMVDLALLAKLVEALPDDARLILAGDKDQLASVQAGSVLGDICNRSDITGYPIKSYKKLYAEIQDNMDVISDKNSLNDCIVVLKKNYRFSEDSRIGRLSVAVNKGEAEYAIEILKEKNDDGICWEEANNQKELYRVLEEKIIEGYSSYLNIDDPISALNLLGCFKILCAVNSGPFGIDGINSLAESVLRKKRLIDISSQWYRGRPVLIKENSYNLGLFNGDMGLIMPARDEDDNLYAYFDSNMEAKRKFKPGILPKHETAYAMTVHKSQGSEFDNVVVVLPEKDYPVLTRELIYTGITRTTGKLTIVGTESILRTAILRKTQRTSGLNDALWG
ncbi:MAG: exodeoxyribonuclease V subunit alpha [Pseudomonadota bacterium]